MKIEKFLSLSPLVIEQYFYPILKESKYNKMQNNTRKYKNITKKYKKKYKKYRIHELFAPRMTSFMTSLN